MTSTVQWKKGNQILEILTDPKPRNPRKSWNTIGIFICSHPKYCLGDCQINGYPKPAPEDIAIKLDVFLNPRFCGYLRTTPFVKIYDFGLIGHITVARATLKDRQLDFEAAQTILEEEIDIYGAYLSRNVFGYLHYRAQPFPNAALLTEKRTGWGFYGNNHVTSGLLCSAGIETLDGWRRSN